MSCNRFRPRVLKTNKTSKGLKIFLSDFIVNSAHQRIWRANYRLKSSEITANVSWIASTLRLNNSKSASTNNGAKQKRIRTLWSLYKRRACMFKSRTTILRRRLGFWRSRMRTNNWSCKTFWKRLLIWIRKLVTWQTKLKFLSQGW